MRESFRIRWVDRPAEPDPDAEIIERRIGEHTVRVYVHENIRTRTNANNQGVSRYTTEWYLFVVGAEPEWPVTFGYKNGDAAARLQVERALRWYEHDPRRLDARRVPPGALPPPPMPEDPA